MNRYTKKKSKKTYTVDQMKLIVKVTTMLNLNVMLRTLYLVEGWRDIRLNRFMESYLALMEEVGEGRTNVNEFNRDTKALTGIDAYELLDRVCNSIAKKMG